VRSLRETDTATTPHARRLAIGASQPKGAIGKEIGSVQFPVDRERLAETARTAAEIAERFGAAPPPHQRKSDKGLQSANQHARALPLGLTGKVEAKRNTVDLVDVGAMRRSEERRIARTPSRKGMTRRVAREVGLRFDDAAGNRTFFALTHENAAEKCLR
jgi:hypothetical protein